MLTAAEEASPAAGHNHEAVIYHGERGFLDATVGFVRDGVLAGQPVMVVVSPRRMALLSAGLGAAAGAVRFVDMTEAGRNPARLIPLWRDFVGAHPGVAVRGVGEPVWAGRSAAELDEALLHEALLNVAFPPATRLWLRCPYDAHSLSTEVVAAAYQRHPCVISTNGSGPRAGYGGAAAAVAEFALPLPDAPSRAMVDSFDTLPQVRRLRAEVQRQAAEVCGPDRAQDLALAVHEVAVNSLRHGGGSGTLSLWVDGPSLVCEVRDRGHITNPLVGRVAPLPAQRSGRGVWLANQLCDLVQLRSGPAGTTVRMHLTGPNVAASRTTC